MNLFIEMPPQGGSMALGHEGPRVFQQPVPSMEPRSVERDRRADAAGKGPGRLGRWSHGRHGGQGDAAAEPAQQPDFARDAASTDGCPPPQGMVGRTGYVDVGHAKTAGMPYSSAQETYAAEVAYARSRHRRRKLAVIARALLLVILMPVLFVAVFLVSYAVTCVLNGSSPEQVVELMGAMFLRLKGLASDVLIAIAGTVGEVMP